MSQPFQFSTRRMFVYVSLFAAALCAISRMRFATDFDSQTLLLLAGSALFGAAFGELVGRRSRGLILGILAFPPTWLGLCYFAWTLHRESVVR